MNDKEDVCTGYPCGSLPFFCVCTGKVVIEKKQTTEASAGSSGHRGSAEGMNRRETESCFCI